MIKKPKLIAGEIWKDDRGQLKSINDFNFKNIKRFYEVGPNSKNKIRAFHGHFIEEKYVYVVSGKILVSLIKLSDKINPSKNMKVEKFVLTEKNPSILYIPAGYANGFKIIEKNSRVIFYSTLSVAASKKDDYRFDKNYWGKEAWNE